MAYIGKKPEDKFRGLASYNSFTGDGSTTAFDVTNILPDGGTYDIEVFVDNVRQEGGSGKSYTIGNDDAGDLKRITFSTAPDNGAEIYVINPGRPTQLNTVSDNAITAAKLQTDAVTTAKIQDDAVTSAKIADGTIVSSNIAPGTIANDRLTNSSITINGNAVSLGGSITAGTDWQAVTVADGSTTVNAVAGRGYFLDTNAGVIEVFLPTSPTRGDTIILMDYAGTFATNQVIVNTGTTNLDSTTTRQYKLTTNDTIAEFVYVDSAKGWVTRINTTTGTTPSSAFNQYGGYDSLSPFIVATGGTITTSGDYKIHTFTGDGTFTISTAPTPANNNVDYLVVAGGGGGGGQLNTTTSSGGGGAGGFRESHSVPVSGCYTASPLATPTSLPVSATTYPVTVGAGGAKGCNTAGPNYVPANGSQGSNSVFSTITSTGGGYGSGNPSPAATAGPGGSGGGAKQDNQTGPAAGGGLGNTPPVSPSQGFPGGASDVGAPEPGAGSYLAGGGGGATQAGGNPLNSSPTTGYGGAGATTSISGSPTTYAGGGGAGASNYPSTIRSAGAGGSGGGGVGNPSTGPNGPTSGTANTGGGGGGGAGGPGGSYASCGGTGGKGIVIIRYKFQ